MEKLHKDKGKPPILFLWHLLPWLILALGVGSLGLGIYRKMGEGPWATLTMGWKAAERTRFFLWLALPVIPIGVFLVLRTLFHLKLWLAIVIAFAVFGLLLPLIVPLALEYMFQ